MIDRSLPSVRAATRFLASVRSVDEARLALRGGADVIDCKDPGAGALGALPCDIVTAIRRAVPGHVPVSATAGDLVPDPGIVIPAIEAMAATGAGFVKLGIFPGGDAVATVRALGRTRLGGAKLVGLLLADRDPDFSLISAMADAGFAGVMLDTAEKSGGALPDVLPFAQLKLFAETAHRQGMFAGLAGSLRLDHIAPLLRLKPDLLGFRGALCRAGQRRGELDITLVKAVREAIPTAVIDQVKPHKLWQHEVQS